MRLLLDTNVVASAMLWGGVPRLLLQAAHEKRVTLFPSTLLLAELTYILGRRKFKKKITASMLSVDQLVDRYAALCTLVRPTPLSGIAPDPDDDVVIGTALAVQVDCIVTGDQPLLSVGTYQDVRLISVSEAVRLIATAST
jgi:putative PIN family toxin of toxin-antitoxin system